MQTQFWHRTLVGSAVLVTMISGGTVLAASNSMSAPARTVSVPTRMQLERLASIPLPDFFNGGFRLSNVLDNAATPSAPATLNETTTPSLNPGNTPSTAVSGINTKQDTEASAPSATVPSDDGNGNATTTSSSATNASSVQYISSAATPSFDFTTAPSASQDSNNDVDISGLTATKGKHHDKGDHLSSVEAASASSSKKAQKNGHQLPATGDQITPWLIIPGLLSLVGAGALFNRRHG